MGKSTADLMSNALTLCTQSFVSIVKLITKSHKSSISADLKKGDSLIIMGNGPSLRQTIDNYSDTLSQNPLLAVNFAANTDDFFDLKPAYYVLADPVFFEKDSANGNVRALQRNLNRVDWKIILFVPFGRNTGCEWIENSCISVKRFNLIGVEGFEWLCREAMSCKRGMPRPRNVLIPSIMIGLWMGYRAIYLTGADHSWTRTLDVDANNRVISVQPHFYEDDGEEKKRVATVYENVRLHEILDSFRVAFKSYFEIERFALLKGATIINATPGSFIDAFQRGDLPDISNPSL